MSNVYKFLLIIMFALLFVQTFDLISKFKQLLVLKSEYTEKKLESDKLFNKYKRLKIKLDYYNSNDGLEELLRSELNLVASNEILIIGK